MDLAKSFRKIYHIEDSSLERLQASLSRKTFAKGERIITQGDVSDYLFIIEEGIVRCFYEDIEEATETTLLFGIEGNLFTSLASVVYDQPSQTSYEALSDVTVLYISFNEFWKLCDECPDLMRWQSHYQLYQLYTLEKRATLTGIGDAYTRYMQYIKMRGADTLTRIPLKYVSQYLNISQETLSRIRSRIAKTQK
ncbi:MAG: Crp/Fnr family transcriptional regulator [Muribaculaceae bacterium]|nr:Crp/Fnr family transcriptional regulator [Muribaculaceae bacterium]